MSKPTEAQLRELSKLSPSEIKERKRNGIALVESYKPVSPVKPRMDKERAVIEMAWIDNEHFSRAKLARQLGCSPAFVYKVVAELKNDPDVMRNQVDRARKIQEYITEKIAAKAARELDDPNAAISLNQLLDQLTKQMKSIGADAPNRSLVAHIDGSDMKMPDKETIAAFTYRSEGGERVFRDGVELKEVSVDE